MFYKSYKHYNFRVLVQIFRHTEIDIQSKVDEMCDLLINKGLYACYEYKCEDFEITVLMKR